MRKLASILLLFLILNSQKVYSVNDPSIFSATAVSDSSIDLSWILNINGDSVIIAFNTTNTFGIPVAGIYYHTTDNLFGGGIIINKGINAIYSNTGLLQNTTYYYKIWSVSNGNIYSTGILDSATTLCSPAPSFIQENFEYGGNIPFCWSQEFISGSLGWVCADGNPYSNMPDHAFEGGFCAFFGCESGNYGSKTKLVMPPIDFSTSGGAATLGFWACVPSTDYLKVYYKTSLNGTWSLLMTIPGNNESWMHYLKTQLPDLSNDYYIAFEGTKSGTLKSGICIDNIFACRGNCCILPSVSTISGPPAICLEESAMFSVINISGNTYYWSLSEGNNTSYSMGTHEHEVNFSLAGTSMLYLMHRCIAHYKQ